MRWILVERLSDLMSTLGRPPVALVRQSNAQLLAEFAVEAATESQAMVAQREIFRSLSSPPFTPLVDVVIVGRVQSEP